MNSDASRQYEALTAGTGLVDFRGRTLIEMSGADAASFLQSFCTQDVKRLAVGEGCEAFITSVQGKVLGHVMVRREAERIVLDTVPGEGDKLMAHLDRYIFRADVKLADRSSEWGELLLGGRKCSELLQKILDQELPVHDLSCVAATVAGRPVMVQRADRLLAESAFLVRATMDDWATVEQQLFDTGAMPCSLATFDTVRIEAGWPLYGRDINEQHLPQEVDRDAQAISFRKGCYLGQETVARIDALGHVNRKLRGLKFTGNSEPPIGLPLMDAEKQVGEVTSATWSPKFGAPLALGYVRRGHNEPGTRLTSSLGDVEVVQLPQSR